MGRKAGRELLYDLKIEQDEEEGDDISSAFLLLFWGEMWWGQQGSEGGSE